MVGGSVKNTVVSVYIVAFRVFLVNSELSNLPRSGAQICRCSISLCTIFVKNAAIRHQTCCDVH